MFAFQMTTDELIEAVARRIALYASDPSALKQEHRECFFGERGLKFILSYIRSMGYEQGYKAALKNNKIKTRIEKVYKIKRVKDDIKIMRKI